MTPLETQAFARASRPALPDTTPFAVPPPARWFINAQPFERTGGLVTGDELAELIRCQCREEAALSLTQPVSLVARWIVAQAVVTVEGPRGCLLPLFQFDLPRAQVYPSMRPLLSDLRGVFDPAELALWFVTPNDWLGGACPARAMHTDLPAVRRAARSDRFVAQGF